MNIDDNLETPYEIISSKGIEFPDSQKSYQKIETKSKSIPLCFDIKMNKHIQFTYLDYKNHMELLLLKK